MKWFEVDKEGLAKVLAEKRKAFVVLELLSNALDTNAKTIRVDLRPIPGRPRAAIVVADDDPNGFVDLKHAWTLFAESPKKSNPGLRGRFDLGEKLVLALCDNAVIESTTGSVVFDAEGRHVKRRRRAEVGSVFRGTIRLNRAEVDEALAETRRVLPPPDVAVSINGTPLKPPAMVAEFECTLPTVIGDVEGNLRKTARSTRVRVYDVHPGDTARLYELGIPVVETGDRYHVNIMQRVPLSLQRDNVTPGYLARVRAAVLERVVDRLSDRDVAEQWVREAAGRPEVSDVAVRAVMRKRFGDKRVSYDPSDREANDRAVAAGYKIVYGSTLSAAEWSNARRAGAIKPAGQVTPSPKPYTEGGHSLTMVPVSEWSPQMQRFAAWVRRMGREIIRTTVDVRFTDAPNWNYRATWSNVDAEHSIVVFNLGRMRRGDIEAWPPPAQVLSTVIHEFAHRKSPNHLSDKFHQACTYIAGQMVLWAAGGALDPDWASH